MVLSIVYVGLFVVLLTLLALQTRLQVMKDSQALFHPLHLSLSVYCAVNILICFWEISLFFNIKRIQDTFAGYKKRLESGQLPNPLFLFQDITLSQAISLEHWHDVWATYALLDVSYSQSTSFGFNIDVGNGFSTLIPTLSFLLASVDPQKFVGLSPRTFGFISALFFYQAFYGTVVYMFSYVNNKRWKDHGTPIWQICVLVIGMNFPWIIGPLGGLYASFAMVRDDNVNILF